MRNDELEIAEVPTDDRPADSWEFDSAGNATRTWTGLRRQVAVGVTFASAIAFGVILVFVPKATLFKPGPLSSPHAQILAGTLTSERCGACHQDAALSPAWGGDTSNERQTQSALCMKCHEQTIEKSLATKAHNLSSSARDQLSAKIRSAAGTPTTASLVSAAWSPKSTLDHENVACATCHKEHHGAGADLNAMTSAQCQSCHSVQYGAFATSHPSWQSWPYGRGGEIAFDHVSHLRKHAKSPADTERLQCDRCHQSNRGNLVTADLARSTSYDAGCAACHDESLGIQVSKGFAVLSLPTIPPASAEGIGWPDLAVGFPDGVLPPLTELLLRSDPEVAKALRRVPHGDIAAIPEDDLDETAQVVARAIRKLVDDVAERGQEAILERLVSSGIAPQTLLPVIRSIPPQWLGESDWFEQFDSPALGIHDPRLFRSAAHRMQATGTQDEMLDEDLLVDDDRLDDGDLLSEDSDDALLVEDSDEDLIASDSEASLLSEPDSLLNDPLSGDPLSDDPLASDPLAEPISPSDQNSAVDPSSLVSMGGWYRDDIQLAVRYRARGHSDEVMASMIETFAQLSQGDPLRRRFFELPSVAACVECHDGATRFPAVWRAAAKIGDRSQFTKFSHGPHLNVSALGDCVHCHQVSELPADGEINEMTSLPEFHPITRESCAACHTPNAAGDNCTTCHRYHIAP